MYLRRTQRRTKDGGAVGYLQLAHNVWDRASRQSRVRVIHSFGREDQLDRAAIVRLIGSLQRVLEPGQALEATADAELRFTESRPMGGALMLDGLWRRLGIDAVMSGLVEGRRLDPGAERVLFALVANRALEPLSKLAATTWVRERACIDGLHDVSDDACYRTMDWLLEIEEQLCERVYWQTADLLNLEELYNAEERVALAIRFIDAHGARADAINRLSELHDEAQQIYKDFPVWIAEAMAVASDR